jgi:hypothetical protein
MVGKPEVIHLDVKSANRDQRSTVRKPVPTHSSGGHVTARTTMSCSAACCGVPADAFEPKSLTIPSNNFGRTCRAYRSIGHMAAIFVRRSEGAFE